MTGHESDHELIKALVNWAGTNPADVATRAGMPASTVSRHYKSPASTRVSLPTWEKLKAAFPDFPGWKNEHPDQLEPPEDTAYVPVEILPTFAGMGGGGTGDADRQTALIPRALIVDLLRGKPTDFILLDVRGDSMEPDFHHGDQILIDRRDTSPAQPGPFALWDGEWGEYVVKNVERSRSGEVRIFSTNPKYQSEMVETQSTRIIGRPVWFGRRL